MKRPFQGFDNQRRYDCREEIANPSQPSIEVKFLKKRCMSFSSPQSEETHTKQTLKTEPSEFKTLTLPDFEISGSFESSGELYNKNGDKETGNGLVNMDASNDNTSSKLKNSGQNSLKLAIRSKSDGIFEDCSTYNISCPDASPEYKNKDIFAKSIAGSYSDVASVDLENSSEADHFYSNSELAFSSPVPHPDSPDEQTSLSDTFFPQFVEGQPPHPNREDGTSKQQAPKGGDGKRSSKKVRRRHRKNHSEDPVLYECPKCGVSYVIASKKNNYGVCFHCDLCTSVEPEFVKREKLLTWNTCRIC